jgi:hypothetical protein
MTWFPGFWFELPLKVTEVKIQNVTISLQVSLLFDLEYSNIVLIGALYISTKFRLDRTSNIATRWFPWKHTFASTCIFIETTLSELITFSLSILTFSLSRTTVEVISRVAAGEHMVPWPFHFEILKLRFSPQTLMHGSNGSEITDKGWAAIGYFNQIHNTQNISTRKYWLWAMDRGIFYFISF